MTLDPSGSIWRSPVSSGEGRLGVIHCSTACEGSMMLYVACKGEATLDLGRSYDLDQTGHNKGLCVSQQDEVKFARFTRRKKFVFVQFEECAVCGTRSEKRQHTQAWLSKRRSHKLRG